MEGYLFCQSCGTPMDHPDQLGTEKDHSRSTIYCSYCYADGEFTRPDMTLEEMEAHVRAELERTHTPEAVIRKAVARLPNLSRWLGIPAIQHCVDWH